MPVYVIGVVLVLLLVRQVIRVAVKMEIPVAHCRFIFLGQPALLDDLAEQRQVIQPFLALRHCRAVEAIQNASGYFMDSVVKLIR